MREVLVHYRNYGHRVRLEVKTAYNYGTEDEPDWYIEGYSKVWGAIYVKQVEDNVELTWLEADDDNNGS